MSGTRTAPAAATGLTVRPPQILLAARGEAGKSVESANVPQLLGGGALWRPPSRAVVVYRVLAGDHQQTGVVAEVSVADYRMGRIRLHEATDPERVRKLADHTESVGVEQTPVVLSHAQRPELRDMLAAVAAADSTVDFATDTGEIHSVWVVEDPELVQAAYGELAALDRLYIADGHHRMAAAAGYADRHPNGGLHEAADFTLGALFPHSEMRVLAHPRGIPRPAGWSTDGVVAALAAAPGAVGVDEWTPPGAPQPAPGVVAVFLDGRWYQLRLRASGSGPRAALDSVRLDEAVIRPALGHGEQTMVSGTAESAGLAEWCIEHGAIGFLPHPPSISEIIAVSDAGEVMPAKSTWFDPKAPRGLFIRELTRSV